MSTLLVLLVVLLRAHLAICVGSSSLGLKAVPPNGEIDEAGGKRVCDGRIGDCAEEEEEFELVSEFSRRVLEMQRRRYISYETLTRDMIPCRIPGASYYNCGAAEANRYNRGCSVITRCARSIKD